MPRARPVLVAALACASASLGLAQPAPWSPETAAFVFTSQASGNSDLWLQRGATGAPVQLTEHPGQDHAASWFPAGDRIAFQSLREGQRDVFVMAVDGKDTTNLTRHPAQDLLPAVAPDGNRIAFFSDRGIEHDPRRLPGHLYVMPSAGGEPTRVTREPLTSTFGPDWSPDGRSLLFARDFDGDIDLVVLDLDTGAETRRSGTPAAEYGGRYSPDGQRIAFHAGLDTGEARIVLTNLDGSERRELTSGGQHYDPRWSPDGRWILFSSAALGASQFDLMVVPAEGGAIESLIATDADERSAAWSPAG